MVYGVSAYDDRDGANDFYTRSPEFKMAAYPVYLNMLLTYINKTVEPVLTEIAGMV